MQKRTSWMTAIGILSLFIGVLGMLLSSLVILGGVQIEQSLGGVETSLRQTSDREFLNQRTVRLASETESELSEARALILPDGIVSACLSAWLAMMGIGTLLLRPWARWGSISWSMTCFALGDRDHLPGAGGVQSTELVRTALSGHTSCVLQPAELA